MTKITIRNEKTEEHFKVENLTREAFWNVYKPGCDEHLVLHHLRDDDCFIKELDLVAVSEEKIIGHIAYSKAYIEDENGHRTEVIMFGPVSVLPDYQHRGVGKQLIETSLTMAKMMGFIAVLITGNPLYYARFGFVPAFQYDIHYHGMPLEDKAEFFMAKELKENGLKEVHGILHDSPAFLTDAKELSEFDKQFPKKIKRVRKGQLHL